MNDRIVLSPQQKAQKIIYNVVLLGISLCFILPLFWVILGSFDAEATLSAAIPKQFSTENYAAIMTKEMTFLPLFNSFLLSASVAIITVFIAILAAYPLSRYDTPFNKTYMYSILFMSGLPITAMMIPVYSLFVNLNMLDSFIGVILFLSASSLPMAVFMCKNFLDGIPVSLEEAAWVDGATPMKALITIIVPLMKQGIATVSIFVFVAVWGNFFVPFMLFVRPENMPAAVTIYSFFGQYGMVGYGQLAAFSILYTLPAVILYIIITRSLGAFALAGGVKG